MHRLARWTGVAAVALLACLLLAGPASAAKKASPAQAAALRKAVFDSPLGGANPRDAATFAARFKVVDAKVSTVSTSWATASVVPKPKYARSLQGAYVIAVQPAGQKTWVVVDVGTAMVGCGIAPDRVIADLLGLEPATAVCPRGDSL